MHDASAHSHLEPPAYAVTDLKVGHLEAMCSMPTRLGEIVSDCVNAVRVRVSSNPRSHTSYCTDMRSPSISTRQRCDYGGRPDDRNKVLQAPTLRHTNPHELSSTADPDVI